jgi:hypothetical protein
MTPEAREALIEAVTTAHRPRDPFRDMARAAPEWHDLDEEGRTRAYERALVQRTMEAAIDPEGLSSTARAVLRRIQGVRT